MLTASASLNALRLALPHPRHCAAFGVLATMLLLYCVAGLSLTNFGDQDGRAFARDVVPATTWSGRWAGVAPLPKGPPPAPEPLAFRDMSPQDAALYNASIPVSGESNPAARPFVLHADALSQLRSIDCLTAAVYYEAAIEPTEGQRAVAQVVLNRLRHPAFPKTVCGVVFQGSERRTGCQFTFTCDGSLARAPSEAGWERARKVAEAALAGKVYKPVGYATHYHTDWVVPYWSASLAKVANVGTHIFYRWEGGWGRPPAFRYAYAGAEPQVALMQRLSSEPALPVEGEVDPALMAGVTPADVTLPVTVDMKNRAVVRHYEPLRQQAAATTRADLARADVPESLRWALTGDSGKTETPKAFGSKVDPAVAPATPNAGK